MTAEDFYDQSILLLTQINNKMTTLQNAINDNITNTGNITSNTINKLNEDLNNNLDDFKLSLYEKLELLQTTEDSIMNSSFYAKIDLVQNNTEPKIQYKVLVYDKDGNLQSTFLDGNNIHSTLQSAIEQARKLNMPII